MFSEGSGWNEATLKAIFCHRLNAHIMELACCDDQDTLDALIDLATCLDQLIQC